MSERFTRDVVTDLYAAYERRDFDRVAELIDNDVEWIIYAGGFNRSMQHSS
jgi:ketosteroid isomerase-like protein